MRQQLMTETAEFLRKRGHVVSWVIDKAILSPGVPNPDAEIVMTVDGRAIRENSIPAGDVYAVTEYIEGLLQPERE